MVFSRASGRGKKLLEIGFTCVNTTPQTSPKMTGYSGKSSTNPHSKKRSPILKGYAGGSINKKSRKISSNNCLVQLKCETSEICTEISKHLQRIGNEYTTLRIGNEYSTFSKAYTN